MNLIFLTAGNVHYHSRSIKLNMFTFLLDETSIENLQKLSTKLIEASQTGELSNKLNLQLDVIEVKEPEPAPVDLTGGVRATNATGNYNVEFKKKKILKNNYPIL